MKDLIGIWGVSNESIENDSIFLQIYKDHGFSGADRKALELIFLDNLNEDYIQGLNEIKVRDQKTRGKSEEERVDAANFQLFVNLYKEYGYPTLQKIGRKNQIFVVPLFIHFNNNQEQFDYMYKLLYENLKNGNAEPSEIKDFLALKDIENTKNFYFGNDGSSLYLKDLQDNISYDTVKKRRDKYGLPSLELERWRNKIIAEKMK